MGCDVWKEVKLSEIVEIIGGGTPKTKIEEYWNGNIPWLSVKDFAGDRRRVYDSEKKITELGLANSATNLLDIGDIIISARGTVGEIAQLARPMAFNQSCYGLKAKAESTNDFLYYLLRYSLDKIKNSTHGSVFDTITRNTFEVISALLPPLPEQIKIAEVLSSLDDKIELNNQMNNTLDEMAQAIFKSWFIDFEPFQDGEFVDSELGRIPKGWETSTLAEVCTLITKGTTPTTLGKSFADSGVNFVKAESISDNHIFDYKKFAHIDEETNKVLKRSIIKENDILFTIAGTLGRFAFVMKDILPANTNQAIAIIRTNPQIISPAYVYSYFLSNAHKSFYTARIQHAVQPNLSLSTIRKFPILLPDSYTLDCFNNTIESLIEKTRCIFRENLALFQIRDTLLPKLMSGEIRVTPEP